MQPPKWLILIDNLALISGTDQSAGELAASISSGTFGSFSYLKGVIELSLS